MTWKTPKHEPPPDVGDELIFENGTRLRVFEPILADEEPTPAPEETPKV